MSVVELARALIDAPSVTGDEAACGHLLVDLLRDLGLEPQRQVVEGSRFNVHTVTPETRVVLCTHYDTVAPHIPSSEDEALLHGRGACDAKGILAAMSLAVASLSRNGEKRVGLLAVVGEETDSAGARAASVLAGQTTHILVGEPTEGRMATGHKGALSTRLQARGREAHSGYPQWGESAVHYLLDALDEIRRTPWGVDPRLGEATVNVGTVSGGVAANVLAPRAEAQLMIRLVDSGQAALDRLETVLECHPNVEATEVTASDPVSCMTLEGFETSPVAFGSDLPWLEAFGERLLFGPGSIRHAHRPDEHITKQDLVNAVHSYQSIAINLLR